MVITENTRISEIIKANPASIEAIASINPLFNKLRNPILRKLLASRVTIKEAANIGGANLSEFLNKLSDIGFEFTQSMKSLVSANSEDVFPSMETIKASKTLDVREDLKNGTDPFKKIMKSLNELKEGETLLLINTFVPMPLIKILQKKEFKITVKKEQPDLVYTYLEKRERHSEQLNTGEINLVDSAAFNDQLKKIKGLIETVDVRNMEMPLPMVTVLEKLASLDPEDGLFVNHFKVPHFLLPELASRGYSYLITEEGPGEVLILVYKEYQKL